MINEFQNFVYKFWSLHLALSDKTQVFLSLFRKNWPHFVTKFTQNSLLLQNYKHKFILLQN